MNPKSMTPARLVLALLSRQGSGLLVPAFLIIAHSQILVCLQFFFSFVYQAIIDGRAGIAE